MREQARRTSYGTVADLGLIRQSCVDIFRKWEYDVE